MISDLNGRPGDRRNFVHKRLIGAVTGGVGALFGGGNPITGAIGGFARGGSGPAPSPFPGRQIISRAASSFAPTAGCPTGFFRNTAGECVPLRTPRDPGIVGGIRRIIPGGDPGQVVFGEAVLGQFGAALEPGESLVRTLVCPRGTVLGVDGLCYNHRDIKNSERKWPRGRRPLLTGGDMRCISVAASAAKKLERKTKQLQSMGMLKKPATRRGQRALPAAAHPALHIPVHHD